MKKILDNRYEIIKVLLIITMCGQMGLHKLLAWCIPIFNLPYDHPLLDVAYILMEVIALVLCFVPLDSISSFIKEHRLFSLELAILIMVIVVTVLVSYFRVGLRFSNILTHELDYILAFWAIPLFSLLKNEKWTFKSFLKTACILAILGMLINVFGQIYFAITDQHIYCLDSGKDWIDKFGTQRFNPAGFMLFLLPCAIYGYCRAKDKKEKAMCLIFVVLELLYMVFIYQSTTFLAILALVLFFCWFTESQHKLPFYIIMGIGIAGILALLFSGIVSNYIESKRDDCLSSIFWHIHATEYYLGAWAEHPLSGIGFFDENLVHRLDDLNLYISDAGILASWAIGGVTMVLFYLLVLLRGFVLGIKGCIVADRKTHRLIFSLTFFALCMCFSAHWFGHTWCFGVAILLGLTEYIINCEEE